MLSGLTRRLGNVAKDLVFWGLFVTGLWVVCASYYATVEDAQEAGVFGIIGYAGEALVGFLALGLIYIEYRSRRADDEKQRLKQAQTARTLIIYNVQNRIAQDTNVLRELSRLGSWDAANSIESIRWFGRILRGYSQAWGNDDVVTRALDFEFVLLGEVERRKIFEYFEAYAHLQDVVYLFMNKYHVDGSASVDRQVYAHCEEDYLQVCSMIKDVVEEALLLMVVIDFSAPRNNFAFSRRKALECVPHSLRADLPSRSDSQSRATADPFGIAWVWGEEIDRPAASPHAGDPSAPAPTNPRFLSARLKRRMADDAQLKGRHARHALEALVDSLVAMGRLDARDARRIRRLRRER